MGNFNELALFAGAGGSILAGRILGWRTVCAVEWDPYCQAVLLARQADGLLECFPIWDDVRTFDGTVWCGKVDVVTAGFPCQPWSIAGKRKGKDDDRNLWPDTKRIIKESRPKFVWLENSDRLISQPYFLEIVQDLEGLGYEVSAIILGADSIGASIHKKRVWILAGPSGVGRAWLQMRREAQEKGEEAALKSLLLGDWPGGPSAQSDFPREVDGMAHKLDRIKALGNGWVPMAAVKAWQLLTEGLDVG